MSLDQLADYKLAQRELLEAMNELRRIHGDLPLSELPKTPFCAFCGRSESDVAHLVEGLSAHICDKCILAAYKLIVRK
jgi:hypothetical protein